MVMKTRNISVGGGLLESNVPQNVGSWLEMALALGAVEVLALSGEAVRLGKIADNLYGISVSFLQMPRK